MVEFFCPHCKHNTLDSFAVGFSHNQILKCDFCMNKFRVSIVAAEQSVQSDGADICPHCGRLNKLHCGCNEVAE